MTKRSITIATFNQIFTDHTGGPPVYDTRKESGKDHTPVFSSMLVFPIGSVNVLSAVTGRGDTMKDSKAELISNIVSRFPNWEKFLPKKGPQDQRTAGKEGETSLRPTVAQPAEDFDIGVPLDISLSTSRDVVFHHGELRVGENLKVTVAFCNINSFPSPAMQARGELNCIAKPTIIELTYVAEECKSFAVLMIEYNVVKIFTTPDNRSYSTSELVSSWKGKSDGVIAITFSRGKLMNMDFGSDAKASKFLFKLKRYYVGPEDV